MKINVYVLKLLIDPHKWPQSHKHVSM